MTDVNRFRIYFGLILDEATVAATVDFHDATPIRSERQLTMARTSTCGKDGIVRGKIITCPHAKLAFRRH
jgi:hypothetical protein